MPIIKSLKRAERERYTACLERLRAKKCDVLIPPEWMERCRSLDITIGSESEVVQGSPGVVVYGVWLRLVALRSYVVLTECACETEWDDGIVLQSFQNREPIYRIGPWQRPSADVLNDRMENSLRFTHRGQMAEGMLVFVGIKPIPECYPSERFAPFKLKFLDQFENEIEFESELSVSRAYRKTALAGTSVRRDERAGVPVLHRTNHPEAEQPVVSGEGEP